MGKDLGSEYTRKAMVLQNYFSLLYTVYKDEYFGLTLTFQKLKMVYRRCYFESKYSILIYI